MTLARGELKETDPRGPAESVAEAPLYLTFRGLVVSLQKSDSDMFGSRKKR